MYYYLQDIFYKIKPIITTKMLFDKKTKKAIKTIWTIVAVLIILSMVMLYTPFWK